MSADKQGVCVEYILSRLSGLDKIGLGVLRVASQRMSCSSTDRTSASACPGLGALLCKGKPKQHASKKKLGFFFANLFLLFILVEDSNTSYTLVFGFLGNLDTYDFNFLFTTYSTRANLGNMSVCYCNCKKVLPDSITILQFP